MHFTYKTKLTCSYLIEFDINDNIISNIVFSGGCHGNLKAIGILLEGQTCDYVIKKLKGNTCRNRGTSCADQLAIAVESAINSMYETK